MGFLSFKNPAITQIRVFSFVQSNDPNQGRSYFYQRLSALVIVCTVYRSPGRWLSWAAGSDTSRGRAGLSLVTSRSPLTCRAGRGHFTLYKHWHIFRWSAVFLHAGKLRVRYMLHLQHRVMEASRSYGGKTSVFCPSQSLNTNEYYQ